MAEAVGPSGISLPPLPHLIKTLLGHAVAHSGQLHRALVCAHISCKRATKAASLDCKKRQPDIAQDKTFIHRRIDHTPPASQGSRRAPLLAPYNVATCTRRSGGRARTTGTVPSGAKAHPTRLTAACTHRGSRSQSGPLRWHCFRALRWRRCSGTPAAATPWD